MEALLYQLPVCLMPTNSSLECITSPVDVGVMTQVTPGFPAACVLGLAYASVAQPAGAGVQSLLDYVTGQLGDAFALHLCPSDSGPFSGEGSLVLGVPPPGFNAGGQSMLYTPIVRERYYAVQVVDLAIGGASASLPCAAYNSPAYSIIDSGTTQMLLPPDVFAAAANMLQPRVTSLFGSAEAGSRWIHGGSTVCSSWRGTAAEIDTALPTLTVSLLAIDSAGVIEVAIQPSRYARPTSHCNPRGPDAAGKLSWNLNIEPACSAEAGVTLGLAFLRGLYVDFDRGSKRIGIAPVSGCSTAVQTSTNVSGPFQRKISSCAPGPASAQCRSTSSRGSAYVWPVAIGSAIALLCLIVLIRTRGGEDLRQRDRKYATMNDASYAEAYS